MAKRVTEEEKVEMLRLYAEGMTCEAIGRELGRPPNTVRYHIVPNLREKTLITFTH